MSNEAKGCSVGRYRQEGREEKLSSDCKVKKERKRKFLL